jgi:hypothetical protein
MFLIYRVLFFEFSHVTALCLQTQRWERTGGRGVSSSHERGEKKSSKRRNFCVLRLLETPCRRSYLVIFKEPRLISLRWKNWPQMVKHAVIFVLLKKMKK